jgi:hypothetical protein
MKSSTQEAAGVAMWVCLGDWEAREICEDHTGMRVRGHDAK